MAKLSSMKPMFPSDPQALASMFTIPDDSYYQNIPSSSKPLKNGSNGSNSPRNLNLYSSFDIYGNEIQMSNANRMQIYQDEVGSGANRGGLRINKENMNPRTNAEIPMKNYEVEGREMRGLFNRNPLVNITPVVPVKKIEEQNETIKVEVKIFW